MFMRLAGFLPLSLGFWLGSACAHAEVIQLRVVGGNVESGDADTETIAARIEAEQNVDIWGLFEVAGQDDTERYERAAEEGEDADFELILGSTGRADKLVIIYNADRMERIERC